MNLRRRDFLRTGSTCLLATAGCLTGGSGGDEITPKEWPEDYYDGPIFSVHEHFITPKAGGWKMTADRFDSYRRWTGREHVSNVLAFMTSDVLSVVRDDLDWVLPYCIEPVFKAHRDPERLDDLADMYRQALDSESAWRGIGEIAMHSLRAPEKKDIKPDRDAFMEVYELAAKRDMIVMVHPKSGRNPEYDGHPAEHPGIKALERAFRQNRDTTFLIHGLEPGSWIIDLLDRHPNWYYDTSGVMHQHFRGPKPGEKLAEHVTEEHIQDHVNWALKNFEEVFRAHPKRVMTGFDMGHPWHHDPKVMASLVKIYRAIFGALPQDIAERVAYKNAETFIDNG